MENKTKKYIKNILLGIALLPYMIIIVMSLYSSITGHESYGRVYYGFDAIGNYLGDLFNDWINLFVTFPINLIAIPIIVLWIGYKIYYFITFKRIQKENKTEIKENNRNISKKINFKKIIFYICITCWCIYLASGIFAFFFGSPTGGGLFNPVMEYGVDALVHTLVLNLIGFSIIPILPISLLYIIIYVIVNKRKKKKEMTAKSNIDQTNIEN